MPTQKDSLVLLEILIFFQKVFECKTCAGYKFADYSDHWLRKIDLTSPYAAESAAAKTTRILQEHLTKKFGSIIKVEARVGEDMSLKFLSRKNPTVIEAKKEDIIDARKLQAFDILDLDAGSAFEISLSDAFAEFFKDLLKSLLDSRVKKLYFCARNHRYKGSKKSGFIKVRDSGMIQQYITLARLYKLEIELVDLFPKCNQ